MKKSILLIASVMAAGCSISEFDQQTAIQVKELTITASRESDGPETRTVRNESNGAILWTPGDRISLFYGSGADGGSEFTSQGTTNSKVTNFTGTIGVITGGADVSVQDTYFWGLYPYDESASCDGESITMTLSDYQVATPGTFAPNTFPAIGRSPGLNMPFYNICGGLKIQVHKEGLKKVTLHSNDGPIAGKARIVLDGSGVPSVAEIIDGSEDIVLEAPAGEYLVPGKNYYFVIFPHEFKDNYFTLTFESFTEIGTYERKKPFTITRSVFEGFSVAIDGNVTYEQKTGYITIEDANFKAYLVDNYDMNEDGEIDYDEAAAVTEIEIITNNVHSLEGIEYFPNLQTLICSGISGAEEDFYKIGYGYPGPGLLTSLDVSANNNLQFINCGANLISSLILGSQPNLNELWCVANSLTNLDLRGCTKLWRIWGDCNSDLNSVLLPFSQYLKTVELKVNKLETLDLSLIPNLEVLNLDSAQITDVDLAQCPNLFWLSVSNTNLTELDLSANPNILFLYCDNLSLEDLDLSKLTDLYELCCSHNSLTELDVSRFTHLTILSCFENSISNLIVPTSLKELRCWSNPLGSFDVSELTDLEVLCIADAGLVNLDVTCNSKLRELAFNGNNIGSIDLSLNTNLEELACWESGLFSLDLSKNPKLTWLRCWNNYLTSLDVSHNLLLGYREVSGQDENENGLYCCQLDNEDGVNYLQTLYIADGQVIPFVTENRSEEHIPASTVIRVTPNTGENEGSGDHENEP